MIECSGEFSYGKVSARITEIITSPFLQEYLQDKNKWDTQTFNSINWKAMGAFMKSLTGEQETNVIKLVHNWQNDGHQNHLHSEGKETPECPVCGKYEHHYHFFYCKNSQMTQQYNKCRDTFIKAHKKMHTASSIFHIFKQVLLHLRQGKEPPFPDLPNDKIGVIVKKAWNQQ